MCAGACWRMYDAATSQSHFGSRMRPNRTQPGWPELMANIDQRGQARFHAATGSSSREAFHFTALEREAFRPPPLQAKAGWKTLEAELQYQSQFCHDKLQKDLDALHAQVLSEVHRAVAQELQKVCSNMEGLHNQVVRDVATLSGTARQEVQSQKELLERRTAESSEAMVEAVARVSLDTHALVKEEAALRQTGLQELQERLSDLEKAQGVMGACCADLEQKCQSQDALWSSQKSEHIALLGRVAKTEEELEGLAKAQEPHEELRKMMQAEAASQVHGAALQLRDEWRAELQGLQAEQEALASKAASLSESLRERGEIRLQEMQAALDALASREDLELRRLTARMESVETLVSGARNVEQGLQEQVSGLVQSLEDRQRQTSRDLDRVQTECRAGLALAHSSFARILDWRAEVDVPTLQNHGKLDVISPKFAAAGLEGLQLQLRLQALKGRWQAGLFLQAPCGQVSFKLQVANKSMSFCADFAQAPEWGSQRLAVLESVDKTLHVRLEIMDITVPLTKVSYPTCLTVSAKSVDAAQAAAREATALRSAMVKRVEWRVGQISERIAAARAAVAAMGEEEAWQPIVSPPFAAGGFEGLQLHLYPLGYRTKGEEMCGFFLVGPKGMYVKCKAFVGDMVRNWDHHFDEKEPYGRGNFCRLLDKVDGEDSVLCGIELQEIRMEHTSQVRGGPFGSIIDEMKLVAHPSVGSMELIRELRDGSLKDGKRRKGKPALQQFPHLAPALDDRVERIPVPLPGMGVSKSSPQLPPASNSPIPSLALPLSPKASKWR
ncbi:unnamed protein product [Effrenium voratum]|nr:unnamed protein product [Effrenium voratum]